MSKRIHGLLNHHFKMLMKSDLFSNEQKLQPNPLTEIIECMWNFKDRTGIN